MAQGPPRRSRGRNGWLRTDKGRIHPYVLLLNQRIWPRAAKGSEGSWVGKRLS